MIVLNYSHPLTEAQLAQIEIALGSTFDVRSIPTHVDRSQPLARVAQELADAAALNSEEWQSTPLVINPPGLAPVAMALLAEIHGRCGHFPAMLHIRPIANTVPTQFEVAEIVDLQAVRDQARTQR